MYLCKSDISNTSHCVLKIVIHTCSGPLNIHWDYHIICITCRISSSKLENENLANTNTVYEFPGSTASYEMTSHNNPASNNNRLIRGSTTPYEMTSHNSPSTKNRRLVSGSSTSHEITQLKSSATESTYNFIGNDKACSKDAKYSVVENTTDGEGRGTDEKCEVLYNVLEKTEDEEVYSVIKEGELLTYSTISDTRITTPQSPLSTKP